MSIRVPAFALLIAASAAIAAPPKHPPSKSPPTGDAQTDNVDVDAMARAKDVGGNDAASGDAAASGATPAPAQAPAAETTTPAEPSAPAPSTDATPADAASTATEAVAPAAPAQPSSDTAAAAPPSAEEQTEKSIAASCVSRTASLLDDAEKADYGNATRDFDAKMRTALPAPKFKEAWESLAQFGKLVARGQSHLGTGEGYTLVMVPLVFEKANLVAQVACGSDGRIAGFHVTPAPKPQF